MRNKTTIVIVLAAAAFLVLTVALAFGTGVEAEYRDGAAVITTDHGEHVVIKLADLADGETRTFEEDGKTITCTRKGDSLEISIEGDGEKTKQVWVTSGDEEAKEIRIATKHLCAEKHGPLTWIEKGDADAAGEMKFRCVEVRKGDDGKVEVIIDGEVVDPGQLEDIEEIEDLRLLDSEHGEHRIVLHVDGSRHGARAHASKMMFIRESEDRVTFHCEDDGTDVTIDKDQVTSGVVSCPVCGRPMEHAAKRKIKAFEVHPAAPPKPEKK